MSDNQKASKQRKARVLLDCAYGKCNDVITADAGEIDAGEKAGQLDSSKAAVEYAEQIQRQG